MMTELEEMLNRLQTGMGMKLMRDWRNKAFTSEKRR